MTIGIAVCVWIAGMLAHPRPTLVSAAVGFGVYAVGARRLGVAVLAIGVVLAFAGIRIDALQAAR